MAVFGPDWPATADLVAANEAALESLATPWAPYERYLQLGEQAGQTRAAFFRGCEHRMAKYGPAAEPGPEPEAGG